MFEGSAHGGRPLPAQEPLRRRVEIDQAVPRVDDKDRVANRLHDEPEGHRPQVEQLVPEHPD